MINLHKIAAAYHKLLTGLDWSDDVLVAGLREGLDKFLSNAYLKSIKGNKYSKADYISEMAQIQINGSIKGNLVFEHIVPKKKYVQGPCEELARNGKLTIRFIEEQLEKYWHIAIITKSEDALLHRTKMPIDWDEKNIFARYDAAGIKLKRMEL